MLLQYWRRNQYKIISFVHIFNNFVLFAVYYLHLLLRNYVSQSHDGWFCEIRVLNFGICSELVIYNMLIHVPMSLSCSLPIYVHCACVCGDECICMIHMCGNAHRIMYNYVAEYGRHAVYNTWDRHSSSYVQYKYTHTVGAIS